MKRASGRAALTSRKTVRPPRPESNMRMVGCSGTVRLVRPCVSAIPKHAVEYRIDVLEVVAKIEIGLELGFAQMLAHGGIGRQHRLEIAFAAPGFHGVLLYDTVGLLA